jgi:hypothetical protein
MPSPSLFNTDSIRAVPTRKPHTPATLAAATVAHIAFGTPIPRQRIATVRRLTPEQAYERFAYLALV